MEHTTIRARIHSFQESRRKRNEFKNIGMLEGLRSGRATELEAIFKALPNLDLEILADRCIHGNAKGWDRGEMALAAVAEKRGLKPVKLSEPEDFASRDYRKAVRIKAKLLDVLGMIQEGSRAHPESWREYVLHGNFSDMLRETFLAYAFFKELADNLHAADADKWMLALYENEYAVWCCVHKRLEDERNIKPDYSKSKIRPTT